MSIKDHELEGIRSVGEKALETVLNKKVNIKTIEKYIYKTAKNTQEYKKILYQTIGDILGGKELKILISEIKKEMILWEHPVFITIKNRIDEHDEFIVNPFEVEEGVTTCHCGSERVFTYQKQTRGCDEPMTTFAKCVKCKANWSYSG